MRQSTIRTRWKRHGFLNLFIYLTRKLDGSFLQAPLAGANLGIMLCYPVVPPIPPRCVQSSVVMIEPLPFYPRGKTGNRRHSKMAGRSI